MKRLALLPALALVLTACQDATQLTTPKVSLAYQGAPVNTFTVTNTDDAGAGSLRQAILDANASAGTDLIDFNIPGAGPHTIQPTSLLPTITDPVVIDGYTQPGASPNTNPPSSGSNAILRIELDGTNAGSAHGLHVAAGSSTVRGLVINRFSRDGIFLTVSGNIIEGNFIGTNVAGTLDLGNAEDGVDIRAPDNTVGGLAAGTRNVISGNGARGVVIQVGSGSLVLGNLIGTDASGMVDLGNTQEGVVIRGVPGNTIGGTSATARNIISGNRGGVLIKNIPQFPCCNNATDNLVQGNFIGTDVAGTGNVGNAFVGVAIVGGSGNTIGGTEVGAANVISFNGARGVSVISLVDSPAIGNAILSNSIFSNTGLGIDLGASGVTPNDLGDGDTGANNLMNFPVFSSALAAPGRLVVRGTIDTPNPRSVTIQLFGNPVPTPGADPSGHGEGAVYLGTVMPNTRGMFTAALPAVQPGTLISATATDADGNTSEFAANIVAVGPPVPVSIYEYNATCLQNCQAIGLNDNTPVTGTIRFDATNFLPSAVITTDDIQNFRFTFGNVSISLASAAAYGFVGSLAPDLATFSSFELNASESTTLTGGDSVNLRDGAAVAGPNGRCTVDANGVCLGIDMLALPAFFAFGTLSRVAPIP